MKPTSTYATAQSVAASTWSDWRKKADVSLRLFTLKKLWTVTVFFLMTTLATAQNLLIDATVSNTTPGASDVITYKIRYRCASITNHCLNAHITFTLPDAYDIVSTPGSGGNVAGVTMTGNVVDISLVSPPSSGAPAGALAAGASGILETKVKFKCGTNGVAPMPVAGTTVNFAVLPTFTVTGGSQVAVAPPAVTVPTVSVCPAPAPNPPATNIFKGLSSSSFNPKLYQQGGSDYYTIQFPAIASGTWTVTDDIPDGIYITSSGSNSVSPGCGGMANLQNVEVQLGGVWYSIFDFNGGYCGDKFDGWINSVPNIPGTQMYAYDAVGGNLVIVPGCFRNGNIINNVDKIRWTVGAGPANFVYLSFIIDPNAVPGPRVNCLTTDNPAWSTVCAPPIYITEKPAISAFIYSDNYFHFGTSNLNSTIQNQNLYTLSGNPNLYKDPLDGIASTSLYCFNLQGGGLVYEQLLPAGFEYSTDPTRPNFWFQVQDVPNACATPTFTSIPNYNGTGQTLLRWEYPNCAGFIQNRIFFSFRYKGLAPLPNTLCLPSGTVKMYNGGSFAIYTPPICVTELPTGNICLNKPVSGGDVNSIKWVKGALDASFSRYPLTGNTNLAGDGTYEIFISSADWQNVKQIDVADILPYIGDQDMLSAALRGSAWSEELAAAIKVERYKIGTGLVNASANLPYGVMYTTAANPCYLDAAQPAGQVKADVALANFGMGGACTDFNNSTPAAAAKGFLFRWSNPADPLVFGEYLKLTIPVRQLTGEADNLTGGVSWNSVAFTATEVDNDELLSSEPLKVGLKMVDQSTTAAIGDYVWLDGNANGRQDAGETPLSGVVVSLYDAAGQPVTQSVTIAGVPTNVPVTAITDVNGYYCFPGLTPNTNYYVRLENVTNFGNGGNLSTYSLTTPNNVADDLDSDATLGTLAGSPVTPRPQILSPTLGAGTQTKTYDFGFICLGSIAGYVWMDTDKEGDQDNNEMALSGITVTLRDAATNAAVGASVMSNASGGFTLSNVPSGNYYVEFTTFPGTKIPTNKDLTGNDNNDSDVNANGRTDVFTLSSCDFLKFDLGLRDPTLNPASICGTAWDDLDKDGNLEVGEPGMANVTVQLLSNGFVVNTTTTDANGDYCFKNLDPNVDYQVAFVPPSITIMFVDDMNTGADQDVDPTTGITGIYTPGDNQNITDVDAGFMGPMSIGNLVWNDINDNGLYENTEPTFSGITVNLIASDGTTVLATTTTDVNGRYLFKYLMAGSYYVEVGKPTGGFRSSTDIGTTPTPNSIDSDDNGLVVISSVGFVRSSLITLVNTGGTAGDANWTEADANQPIMGMFDPAINQKAYYTVDFGFVFTPPCNIALKPTVSGCYQNGGSKSTVSVEVSWQNITVSPTVNDASDQISVTFGGQTKYINPGPYTASGGNGTIVSPQVVAFEVNADGSTQTAQVFIGADYASSSCNAEQTGILLPVSCATTVCVAGQTGGTVFNDYNADGIKQPGETTGLSGVAVNAYDCNGNLVGTTTTDVNGKYVFTSISAGSYPIRVEFSGLPAIYSQGTPNGVDGRTTVQFVSAADCNVDLGVLNPQDYCQTNPKIVLPCYLAGDPQHPGSANDGALVGVNYDLTGGNIYYATVPQLGTVWGTAYKKSNNTVYTAAFVKRHSGLGPDGLGAIYQTNLNTITTSLFVNVATLPGVNLGTISSNAARGLGAKDIPTADPEAFAKVGKVGMGDLDISEDGSTLYFVNLFERKLHRVDIANPTAAPGVDIPNPGCTGGQFRPWALKVYQGKVYVGVVCDGGTSQSKSDLRAYVYTYDIAGGAFNPVPVFDFPLTYPKGEPIVSLGRQGWYPWLDDFSAMAAAGFAANNSVFNDVIIYPVPMLSDIEFDIDGSMVLGLADRTSLQLGHLQPGVDGTGSWSDIVGGDILRAYFKGGVYVLENNAKAGPASGFAPNNNQGPGFGEFYNDDFIYGGNLIHSENSQGALAIRPGSGETVYTAMDAVNEIGSSGGFRKVSNTTGLVNGAYNVVNIGLIYNGFFAKAQSLGDVELTCGNPTYLQIGNYAWIDADKDGVQDPCEATLPGLKVSLYDKVNNIFLASTTTNANGEYYFTGTGTAGENWVVSTGPNSTLQPSTQYTIVFGYDGSMAMSQYNTGTSQLIVSGTTYTITTVNTGEGANPDLNDSDATAMAVAGQPYTDYPIIMLTTGIAGSVNHTYDVGFVCVPPMATFTPTAPTCNVAVANNDGKITFATATAVTNFGISTAGAVTYDGPAYPATAFTAVGQDVSTTIPNTGGTYIVRVFNGAAGCYLDVPVTVAAVNCGCPPLSVSITESNVNVCGTGVATFNYTVTNGPATITTSNGTLGNFSTTTLNNGTGTFTYTPAAGEIGTVINFTATIADPDGAGACTGSTDIATVTSTIQPEAGTGGLTTICETSTTTITLFSLITGGNAGGTWTAGGSNPSGGTFAAGTGTFDPTGATPGTYTFTYAFAAGNGCAADQTTVTVNVTDQREAGAGSSTTICATSTTLIDLFGLLTGEETGGVWTAGGSNPSGGTFTAGTGSFNPTGASVGTYTFTYTFAATGNCALDQASVTVIVSNQPEAGTGGPTTICETSTTTITLFSLITGGDAGGTWTAGGSNPSGGTFTAGTGTFDPTGATPGTYTFTYAFAAGGGCAADQTTVTVNVTDQREAGAGSSTNICATSTTLIDLFGLLTGEETGGVWTASGSNPSGGTFTAGTGSFNPTGASVGTYTFTYTFAATGNCALDQASVTVIVSNQPEAGTGGPTTICETSTTTITLFSLITGGDAGGTWTAGGSNPSGGTFTAGTGTFNPTGAIPGTYTFIYAFAAGGGCAADQTTVTVNVTDQREAGTGNSANICATSTTPIDLFGLLTGEETGGVWTASGSNPSGGTFTAGTGSFNPTGASVGTYTFTYTFAATGGCVADEATVTIIVSAQPEAGSGQTTSVCFTSTSTINLSTLLTGADANGVWTADVTNPSGGTFSAVNGTFNPTGASLGTYKFKYSFAAGGGCAADETTVTINIVNTPSVCPTDFGDLPQPPYATDLTNTGPSHIIITGLKIGATVDAETDGQPNGTATGDGADEDGLGISPMFIAGQSVALNIPVMNMTGKNAKLTFYIDWNKDGDLTDANEMFASAPFGNVSNISVTIDVPENVVLNQDLGMRLRLTTETAMSPTGFATDGEVEDYLVRVMGYDWGDLPDLGAGTGPGNYVTDNSNTPADDGPSHKILTDVSGNVTLKLGASVDAEAFGQPNTLATADDSNDTNPGAATDDEDGITLPMFVTGVPANISVSLMNMTGSAAKLFAFIDWNGDGDFDDTNETQPVVTVNNNDVSATITVTPPLTSVLNTNIGLRFRLSNDMAAMSPTGEASGGEVEDYVAQVMGFDYGDLADSGTGTGTAASGTPANHQTTNADSGPKHKIVTDAAGNVTLKIGASVDDEADGQPSTDAGKTSGGDDNTGTPDDEDGLVYANLPLFIVTQTTTLTIPVMNTTGSTAKLTVFVDFNKDGAFDNTEMFSPSALIANNATSASVDILVPASAVVGQDLGLRIRLASNATEAMSAIGTAQSGEVEDYVIQIVGYDYGDLPDTYVTTGANAPRHIITNALKLGASVDAELDGAPEAMAGLMSGGDDNTAGLVTFGTSSPTGDDENGVKFLTPMVPGSQACIEVTAMNTDASAAVLQMWIDWNGNGTFETGEAVTSGSFNGAGGGAVVPATNGLTNAKLCFDVPADAVFAPGGAAFIRFRLSPSGNLSANSQTTPIPFGEIEDYKLQLGKIGNLVFDDRNFNGVQDAGEPGIQNVSVGLTWLGADGQVGGGDDVTYTSINTDQNGKYYFCGITDGPGASDNQFKLTFGTPTNMTPTRTNQGGNDVKDSDGAITGMDLTMTMESFAFTFPTPTVENGTGDSGTPGVGNFADNQTDETHDQGFAFLDYGDLPETGNGDDFSTTMTKGGAVHVITPGFKLGASIDGERDGAPSADASGDGADEDGVTFTSPLIPGNTATISVVSMNPFNSAAVLQGWIDWDNNGKLDAGEALNLSNSGSIATGNQTTSFSFSVPAGAKFNDGMVFARFRLSPTGGLSANGPAKYDNTTTVPQGEVEDYKLNVGKIGNLVYDDRNFNGVQDSGEPGINGVTVSLIWAGPNGTIGTGGDDVTYTSLTTGTGFDQGEYYFCGLTPGTYKIVYTTPTDMTPTRTNQGSQTNGGTLDSDGAITGMDLTMAMETFTIADVTTLPTAENGTGDNGTNPTGTFPDNQTDETHDQGFAFLDYGDLPETGNGDDFSTTMTKGGAVHVITPGFKLGASIDGERDGAPSADASGDGADEDGVTFTSPLIPGNTSTISVVSMNPFGSAAVLQGWIDWDNNGKLDAGEALNLSNSGSIATGNQTTSFSFSVPSNAKFNDGMVFARFRLSPTGGLSANGPAKYDNTTTVPQGEVEDYKLNVGKIGNLVFDDRNFNGVQDSGEPGINGVTVSLIWAGPNGTIGTGGDDVTYTSLTTGTGFDQGEYYFCGLTPGTYKIVYTTPTDMTPTRTNQGGNDVKDSDGAITGMDLTMAMETFTIANVTNLPTAENGTGDNGTNPTGTFPDNQTDETHDQGFAFLDYGDLPETGNGDDFSTTMTKGGAVHVITPGFKLGASIDGERDGAPSADASGDGADEDGVTFTSPLIPGNTATISVVSMNPFNSAAVLQGWIDWDNNGKLDAGEALNLSNSGSIATGNQTTSFSFSVPAGAKFNDGMVFARFRLSPTGGLSANGPAKYDNTTTVPQGEVEDYKLNVGKIGNLVYDDRNFNGVQDSGEPGINGVTVSLIWAGPNGTIGTGGDDVTYTSLTTGTGFDQGEYYFCGLTPGTYKIVYTTPTNMTPTRSNQGSQTNGGTLDSDGAITGMDLTMAMETFTIANVTNLPTAENGTGDNGTNPTGTFPDNQTDETHDQGFAFLDYGDLPETGNGDDFSTTMTKGGAVHVITPGFKLGASIDGERDGAPSADASGDGADEDGVTFTSPLIPGNTATISVVSMNPFNNAAVLQGWIDWDNNGKLDAGEVLNLSNSGSIATGNQTTSFSFSVPASAKFNDGMVFARFRLSPTGGLSANGPAKYDNTTTVPQGEVEDYKLNVGKIGNLVFEDRNYNGVQDAGEAGINGVTVSLIWAGPNGTIGTGGDDVTYTSLTTGTGFDQGEYYFCGLTPGTYKIVYATPNKWVPTKANQGVSDVKDSDGTTTGGNLTMAMETFTISDVTNLPTAENGTGDNGTTPTGTFPDNQTDETHDMGFFLPVTVGDTAFVDKNRNGLQDITDVGLGNVKVTLYDATNNSVVTSDAYGNPVTALYTNVNGKYLFENLYPGTYYVIFDVTTAQFGSEYVRTIQNVNGNANDTKDSDIDANGRTAATPFLYSNDKDLTLDAGYIVPCAAPVCNSKVVVTLGADCQLLVTPDMVLASSPFTTVDFELLIADANGIAIPGNILTGEHAGKELKYAIWRKDCTKDDICWGILKVENKQGPKVTANFYNGKDLRCTDINTVLNNGKTIGRPGTVVSPGFTAASDDVKNLGIAAFGSCQANCAVKTTWSDNLEVYNCDSLGKDGLYARIYRTWVGVDCNGDKADTTQVINFYRPSLSDFVFSNPGDGNPYDKVVSYNSCTPDKGKIKSEDVWPYFTNYFGKKVYLNTIECGFSTNVIDEEFPICQGIGVKIDRKILIFDWCAGKIVETLHVLIKIGDFEAPTLALPAKLPIILSTGPMDCTASFLGTSVAGLKNAFGITLSDNCDKAITVATRVRTLGKIVYGIVVDQTTWFDVDYRVVNGYTIGLPVGRHQLVISAYDGCYNTLEETVDFYVLDRIAPVMKCDDQLTVTLSNANGYTRGYARVDAKDIDEGSTDNCNLDWIRVRRSVPASCFQSFIDKGYDTNGNGKLDTLDGFDNNGNGKLEPALLETFRNKNGTLMTPLQSFVEFFCCDAGNAVRTELWGKDGELIVGSYDNKNIVSGGNLNFCWQDIVIEDKVAPVCMAPLDVTIDCLDKNLQYLLGDAKNKSIAAATAKIFGDVTIMSGSDCGNLDTTYTVKSDLKCGYGTITRTWTLTKKTSKGPLSTTCSQTIYVRPVHEYNICFPKDAVVNCRTKFTPDTVKVDELACDILAVNVSDKRYAASDDECYKIFRTYTVINWCTYDDRCGDPMSPENVYTVDRKWGEFGKYATYVLVRQWEEIAQRKRGYGHNQFFLSRDTIVDNWNASEYGKLSNQLLENKDDERIFPESDCKGWGEERRYRDRDDREHRGFIHSWMYTQIIKVYDTERPVVLQPKLPTCPSSSAIPGAASINFPIDPASCVGPVSIAFKGTDNCSTALELEPSLIKVESAGSTKLPSDYDKTWSTARLASDSFKVSIKGFAAGSYNLIVVLRDECGNLSVATRIPFTVGDCKAPVPICINGLSTDLMPVKGGGAMTVWAKDFIASPAYDCNGQGNSTDPKDGPNTKDGLKLITKYSVNRLGKAVSKDSTSITVTCADAGKQIPVEVHAWDEKGNHDFCVTYLNVNDNNKVCPANPGSLGDGEIAGLIQTEAKQSVQGVSVELSGKAVKGMSTASDGKYNFTGLEKGYDYTVTPSLDANPLNGVSTFDLVLMQKHILGIQPLDSPYKMIAADINNSKSITTLDLILLRKLILNLDTKFTANTSWRFVDAAYRFPNPSNPWSESFPEISSINNLTSKVNADFVAVKIGDVNGNASPTSAAAAEPRKAGKLELITEEQRIEGAQDYRVEIRAKDLKTIEGYQFTLELDRNKVDLLDIDYGVAKAENFGIFQREGIITTSWNRKGGATEINDDAILFTLHLQGKGAAKLSEALTISSRYTANEANNEGGDYLSVAMSYTKPVVIGDQPELLQNTPNPFADQTQIGFYLPQATEGRLTIRDAKGSIVYRLKADYNKGWNQVTIKQGDLKAAGVLYYTLETPDFTATKKMVLMNR